MIKIQIQYLCVSFFFFQAEDGIRDVAVTGVQTCALPIFDSASRSAIVYAKVVLLSDSSDASPSSVAAAGYTDEVGRFSLQASKPGLYVLQVRHIGHRSVQSPLRLPDSGGVVVSVTLARDADLCSIWRDFCE